MSDTYRSIVNLSCKSVSLCFSSASKARAELHLLHDESATAAKLKATENLVRQQADEKRQLIDQLNQYKQMLQAAGLLPPDEDPQHSSSPKPVHTHPLPSLSLSPPFLPLSPLRSLPRFFSSLIRRRHGLSE